jgi:8-oxo-dGTP pyrophosphatase MutT (NUDIX family)
MAFRAYGIVDDSAQNVLVMGTKRSDFLAGFLVFFGGKIEKNEPSRDSFLRELAEESHKRVECPSDDVRRFITISVTDPQPAELIFFRCTNPTYSTGEIPHGDEIDSVVAVSVDKVLMKLPDDPAEVTPRLVADALVELYGGGADIATYRTSGIMRALREYLVKYYYDD